MAYIQENYIYLYVYVCVCVLAYKFIVYFADTQEV